MKMNIVDVLISGKNIKKGRLPINVPVKRKLNCLIVGFGYQTIVVVAGVRKNFKLRI